MPSKKDFPSFNIDDEISEWTVLSFYHQYGRGWMITCRCSCGSVCDVDEYNLANNLSTRCKACATRHRKTTHGASVGNKDRLYRIWKAMKFRCQPHSRRRKDYFERGIFVCPEWQQSYELFRDWALSNGYSSDLSIDRKDNNKGYHPDNCRWATDEQQRNNSRQKSKVTAFNETKTIKEWSDDNRCCVSHQALIIRLNRKWEPELAISAPKGYCPSGYRSTPTKYLSSAP